MTLRFFDPIAHYADSMELRDTGKFAVPNLAAVEIDPSGGWEGNACLTLKSGFSDRITVYNGVLAENSMGPIATINVRISFKVKFDGPPCAPSTFNNLWTLYRMQHIAGLATNDGGLYITPGLNIWQSSRFGGTQSRPHAAPLRVGAWHTMMIDIPSQDGVQGRVWIDGNLVMDSLGSYGTAVPSLIHIGDSSVTLLNDVHFSDFLIWDSDVAVNDGFTTSPRLETHFIVQVPDSTQETPATVTGAATPHEALDDPLNAGNDGDTTFVQNGLGDTVRVGFPALPANPGSVIKAVCPMAEIDEGTDATPDSADMRVVSNGADGTNFDLLPGIDSGTPYEMFRQVAFEDPDVAGPWDAASAGAAQIAIETVSASLFAMLQDGDQMQEDGDNMEENP